MSVSFLTGGKRYSTRSQPFKRLKRNLLTVVDQKTAIRKRLHFSTRNIIGYIIALVYAMFQFKSGRLTIFPHKEQFPFVQNVKLCKNLGNQCIRYKLNTAGDISLTP